MTTAKKLLQKLRIAPIADRDEATAIAIATAQLKLEQDRVALIRDQKLEDLKTDFDLQIEEYARAITMNTKRLANWAVTHREAEFADKQTIYLGGHKLSFREGTGKVAFAEETKEEDVLDLLLACEDESVAERFVTIKTSLSKQAVITAWRNSATLRELLESTGIRVVKEEKFSFEPDRDAVPAVAPVATGEAVAS